MAVKEAVYAFALSFGIKSDNLVIRNAKSSMAGDVLHATWMGLSVEVPVKPDKNPRNL